MAYEKKAKVKKVKKPKESKEAKMPMKGYKAMMTGLMSSSKSKRKVL